MFNFYGIDHLNITVKNLEKSVDYYQRLFGFEVFESGDYRGTPFKIIGLSNKAMLCMYENPKLEVQNNNIGHFGFNIEFTDDIVEKLEANGNEIELSEKFAGGL